MSPPGARPRVVVWAESGDRAVNEAAVLLAEGRVVAHPTETVYGLAAAADDRRGYEALLRLKGGAVPRSFLLLFESPERLEDRLGPLPEGGEDLARAFWPGPLTLLFPARAGLPPWWSGAEGDVAARVTPHPFCRILIARLGGPVLSTSANAPGEPPLATGRAVASAFDEAALPLVVDGGPLEGLPSTLLRWTERGWTPVREGPVGREALERVLGARLAFARTAGAVEESPAGARTGPAHEVSR
jgi:L-threonylcarbamoyladenylate synthase